MTVVGSAEVLIRAVDTGFEADVKKKVGSAVDKADKTVKLDTGDAEANLSRLGKASGVAKIGMDALASGAAAAGIAIAKMSIDAATDLAESQSKVGQVFGESAAEIEKFAATSARSVGLSKQAALEATGTFGNLFRSMGLGLPEATEMSKGLVTLAADLASFNNIDPTVALEKLRSGLVGEIEPLRALGVNFNAAEVEAKAFALGLADGNGQLNDSAKVQARYALILEKTAIAQGDFGRTSDGLANQQRILKAQFVDLQAEVGGVLIPALTKLGAVVIPLISGFGDLVDKVGGFGVVASGVAKGFGPLSSILDLLPGKQKASSDAADKQKAAAIGLTGATEAGTEAAIASAKASEEQAKALDRVTNATLSALSSQLSYEQAVNTLKDNINDLDDRTREYNEAVAENGANSKEAERANRALRDAHLGIEQSAIAAAGAQVRLADDLATTEGRTLSAQDKSRIFQAALRELAAEASGPTRDAILALANDIDNIPNRTVYVDADTSAAVAAIASLERRLASISSGADSTSGPQQFARGMDMGPVRGPAGSAVPIIAHAGEWVLTPEQLAALRQNSVSPSVTTNSLSNASTLSVTGPLVVVQGPIAPGQEGGIGAAVKQAVVELVRNGTVGQEMWKRQQAIAR